MLKSTLADRVVAIPDLFFEASRFRSGVALSHSLVKYVIRLRAGWFRRETKRAGKVHARSGGHSLDSRGARVLVFFPPFCFAPKLLAAYEQFLDTEDPLIE